MSADVEDTAKSEDFRQSWKESIQIYCWVWKDLMSSTGRKAAKWLALCLCAKNLILMTIPWFLGEFVNQLMARHTQAAERLFMAFIAVSLMNWFFQRLEGRLREIIFGENMGAIDLETSELLLSKSLGQHLRENELLSAAGMEKGRGRAQESMNLICTEATEAVFLLIASYLALWSVSIMAGVVTTLIFAMCIKWSLYLNEEVAKTCAPLDVKFRRWHRHRAERWERVERVKTNGKERAESDHLTTTWDEIIAEDRTFWLWFLSHCSYRGLVSTIGLFCVIGWTGWRVLETGEGIGMLLPLFIWMKSILDNIWRIGTVEHRLSWNLPSLQSMQKALTLEPDVVVKPDAVRVDTSRGVEIEFRDVHHIYHASGLKSATHKPGQPRVTRPVLCGVSFTIKRGERVALLGPSGAGKSTIMRLIQRGFDPERGAIFVNGKNLRDINLASWLESIGYIPQESSVLEGTIRYNLLYGLPEKEKANVTSKFLSGLLVRLKIAERMTEGLDTKLGRGGIELSGGEAQRVMVAAALAKSPHFFLIDEATSSLDSTTEKSVQRAIEEALTENVGALVIAHRLSTVRRMCHKFIVLRPATGLSEDEPQIEAIGNSFEELYQISPTFRRLADDDGIKL